MDNFTIDIGAINIDKDIYLFNIKKLQKYEKTLYNSLPDNEKFYCKSIKTEYGRYRYCMRKALLYNILSKYLKCSSECIEFSYNEYGKPSIKSPKSKIQFNVSHSKEYIIIAISSEGAIGVDIEVDSSFKKKNKEYYKSIYSFNEYRYYEKLSEAKKKKMFHSTWVYKEAISKAIGKGLQCNLCEWDLLDVLINVSENQVIELEGYKIGMRQFRYENVIGVIADIL